MKARTRKPVLLLQNIFKWGGEQVGNNNLDIFWHPRAAHFSGIFAWKSTILFEHEMPLLDIALQLSRNKTRAPSKYSKAFKIFQNLQNISKPSKYSKTFKIFQNLGNLWSKPTSSRDSKTKKTQESTALSIFAVILIELTNCQFNQ